METAGTRFSNGLLEADPNQEHPLDDPAAERRMIDHLVRLMQWNDAPAEQYDRLGLDRPD